jgi:multiple sugar transport system permease protein
MRTPSSSAPRSQRAHITRASLRRDLVGFAFVAPFVAVYLAFLVTPFLRGLWISLHDWNLLAVAFDPSAKAFVGLDNWRTMLGGEALVWSATAHAPLRLAALLLAVGLTVRAVVALRRPVGPGTPRPPGVAPRVVVPAVLTLLFAGIVLGGIVPGPDGAWNDPRFRRIVGLTVPAITALALAIATALAKPGPWAATLRTIFFLSQVLSVTVVTLIWQLLYSPAQGLFATILEALGREPLVWVTNPSLAMPAIVIATVWWSLGFAMVLFLAGLQEIPAERFEAARIDGANGFEVFRFVTLPGIARTLTLVVVFEIVLHFQVFGQAHLITRGGPNDATQTLVRYVYQTAFRDGEIGYASALAMLLFALMLGFTLLQLRLERRTD